MGRQSQSGSLVTKLHGAGKWQGKRVWGGGFSRQDIRATEISQMGSQTCIGLGYN